jgi:hypothetical protein
LNARSPTAAERSTLWPLLTGLIAGLVVVALAFFAPSATAVGWLIAFLIWSSIPIGALVLSLIYRLTGGRWAIAMAPTLRGGLACLPLLLLFFLPILLGLKSLYPWSRVADAAAKDVATFYLNAPGFVLRGLVALGVWSLIAVLLLRGRATSLIAGLGLAFYGLAVCLLSVDWALSIDPRFADSAFGAEIAIQQIMTALAAAAFLQPEQAIDGARGDLGALLLALCLGALYLALMTLIVKWYGDQPDDAAWYLVRAKGPLLALGLGALCLGAVTPIAALSWERVRLNPVWLRAIGAAALVGVVLHDFWFVAPESVWSAFAGIAALVAMAGISLAAAPQIDRLVCNAALDHGVRRDA